MGKIPSNNNLSQTNNYTPRPLLTKPSSDIPSVYMYLMSVRKIWKLPYSTHCHLLPLLCHCLPGSDKTCAWSFNFIYRCVSHDSDLIRFISQYCI